MKCIITVLGKDKVGIVAKVCAYLSESEVNILDMSQTIVKGYFNMMMIVELEGSKKDYESISENLTQIGHDVGVDIKVQHEDIFNCMHRI